MKIISSTVCRLVDMVRHEGRALGEPDAGYERVSQQKGPQWQREFAPSALATNLKREAEGTAFLPPFLNATCQRGKKSDCSAFFGFRHLNVLIIIRSLRNVNSVTDIRLLLEKPPSAKGERDKPERKNLLLFSNVERRPCTIKKSFFRDREKDGHGQRPS
ncbi:hypothetical protein OUZ56_007797 [Daphnia magna]|uniref:Uncharacterized protein n=1 Tax=Daphnia magna TaxID=35525 RepID=A0ABR0AB14_9CRUS|nr:hypothetical protein OUZ56_007797 [Daphnia magna]